MGIENEIWIQGMFRKAIMEPSRPVVVKIRNVTFEWWTMVGCHPNNPTDPTEFFGEKKYTQTGLELSSLVQNVGSTLW